MGEESVEVVGVEAARLVGVRLRVPAKAEDYLLDGHTVHVGDFCLVEVPNGTAVGEVRRPARPLPAFKRERVFPRVIRLATAYEVAQWREWQEREQRAIQTCQERARQHRLPLKVFDVEIQSGGRRVGVSFFAEQRVEFRELVRELAREFHARIEMRQVGARDVTKLTDGIGPCGRQLCCSSYLRKFEPISVKMAKAQDLPLTDSRLLGNCGRLKCCLLYEFSTYEELRSRLPKVGSACQAECGGGCMQGRVKAVQIFKEKVVVQFPDGTEAEVPIDLLTWEGRPHIQPLPEEH
jgi:cell fate regulator YaaT (PSP1 superfamily)